jgi:serine/threonine protein kinase
MGFFSRLFSSTKSGKKQPRIDLSKRFELLGRTGQGSMSKVWRARDKQLGRVVCLKILDKERTTRFEARFPGLVKPNEGAITSSLHHKNIVKTLEHGLTTQGEQFLEMELIEGVGLNFLIETHNSALEGHRIDFLVQVIDAVEYIHEQRFLHRDLCPRNVMVTKEGLVKVIDFGLAVPYTPEFCRPGNRTGTPDYLAPELIRRMTTDHRIDLFALGVTIYETFVGTLPWEKARGSMEVLNKHINVPGRNPSEVRPDLDKATVALLVKAIDRDPRLRFQSAAELRDVLKALPRQDW